jgi:hypothetical protein
MYSCSLQHLANVLPSLETLITPTQFARIFCHDLELPQTPYVDNVVGQIKAQLEEFASVAEIDISYDQDAAPSSSSAAAARAKQQQPGKVAEVIVLDGREEKGVEDKEKERADSEVVVVEGEEKSEGETMDGVGGEKMDKGEGTRESGRPETPAAAVESRPSVSRAVTAEAGTRALSEAVKEAVKGDEIEQESDCRIIVNVSFPDPFALCRFLNPQP